MRCPVSSKVLTLPLAIILLLSACTYSTTEIFQGQKSRINVSMVITASGVAIACDGIAVVGDTLAVYERGQIIEKLHVNDVTALEVRKWNYIPFLVVIAGILYFILFGSMSMSI